MWHGDDAILPADYGYGDTATPAPSSGKDGAWSWVGPGLLALAPAALGLFGSMAGSKAQQQQAAAANCPQVANIDAQIQAIKDSRGLFAKLIHTPWGAKQKQIDALEMRRPGAFAACQQAATYQSLPPAAPAADPLGGININYLLLGGLAVVAVLAFKGKE